MKKTKLLVFILAAALMISGIVGIGVSATGENNTQVAVKSANLSFVNEPALVFAIEHDGTRDTVKLNVWDSEPEDGQAPDYVVDSYFLQTIGGVEYTTFAVKGKNPKNVYDYVWVQPEADGAVGEVVRYSALQYALGGVFKGDEFADMYQSIIDYSAAAQKWTDYVDVNGKTADEYVFVAVNDGTVDGYANSVYPTGTSVTPVYTGEGDYTHWQLVDSTGAELSVVAMGSEIELTRSVRLVPHKPLVDTTYVTDYEGGTPYSDFVKTFDASDNLVENTSWTNGSSTSTAGLDTDPKEAANHLLHIRTAASGTGYTTKVAPSNTIQTGNCYTFETNVYAYGLTANYIFANIQFVNKKGTSALDLNLKAINNANSKPTIAIVNNDGTVNEGGINSDNTLFNYTDKEILATEWCTIRIEFYYAGGNGVSGDEAINAARANSHLKVYVDDILAYDGNAYWVVTSDIDYVAINHTPYNKAQNIGYDDIYFTITDKAYVEGNEYAAE